MRTNKKVQGIIFRKDGNSYEYLLLQRSKKLGGFWQAVTGGVEEKDKDLVDALKREVLEEVKIENPMRIVEGVFSFKYPVSEKFKESVDFEEFEEEVFGVEIPKDFKVSIEGNGEHRDCIWCCYDGASELLEYDSSKEALEKLNEILVNGK